MRLALSSRPFLLTSDLPTSPPPQAPKDRLPRPELSPPSHQPHGGVQEDLPRGRHFHHAHQLPQELRRGHRRSQEGLEGKIK